MAIFEWLLLNNAVDVVARRLVQAEPDRLSDPEVAIATAREEILEQAALGALDIHGIPSDPDVQIQPQNDWKIVHASYWKESRRLDQTDDDLDDLDDEASPEQLCTESSTSIPSDRTVCDSIVYIEWELGSFTFEIEAVVVGGFHSLKVKTEDINRIWPASALTGNDTDSQMRSASPNGAAEPKNKGGRRPKYQPDLWLEIIRIAELHGLPLTARNLLDRPALARQLEEFSISRWGPDGAPKSSTTYDDLLKLVEDWLSQKR